MQDKKTLKEYFDKTGFINKWGLYLSYHPKAENSKKSWKRAYAKGLRKSVGYYFAGNMTTREQDSYGELFDINPRDISIYNSAINFFIMGTMSKVTDSFEPLLLYGVTNLPKIFLALKNNKGYQAYSPISFFQNSPTYAKRLYKTWDKTIENSRGIAEATGAVRRWKGIENILENYEE